MIECSDDYLERVRDISMQIVSRLSDELEAEFMVGRVRLDRLDAKLVRVLVGDVAESIPACSVEILRDGRRVGDVSWTGDLSEEWRMVSIPAMGGQIQDLVIEVEDGSPVPRCPSHSHPMMLIAADSQLWWSCPQTQQQIEQF